LISYFYRAISDFKIESIFKKTQMAGPQSKGGRDELKNIRKRSLNYLESIGVLVEFRSKLA